MQKSIGREYLEKINKNLTLGITQNTLNKIYSNENDEHVKELFNALYSLVGKLKEEVVKQEGICCFRNDKYEEKDKENLSKISKEEVKFSNKFKQQIEKLIKQVVTPVITKVEQKVSPNVQLQKKLDATQRNSQSHSKLTSYNPLGNAPSKATSTLYNQGNPVANIPGAVHNSDDSTQIGSNKSSPANSQVKSAQVKYTVEETIELLSKVAQNARVKCKKNTLIQNYPKQDCFNGWSNENKERTKDIFVQCQALLDIIEILQNSEINMLSDDINGVSGEDNRDKVIKTLTEQMNSIASDSGFVVLSKVYNEIRQKSKDPLPSGIKLPSDIIFGKLTNMQPEQHTQLLLDIVDTSKTTAGTIEDWPSVKGAENQKVIQSLAA